VDINVVMDSPQGLVTPVVKDVSGSGLKHIAKVHLNKYSARIL
jgi:pyruvate/2-oxoglutarate dehydrogenase complex dihydrolipoamide acyltransferase (E2) component